MFLPSVIIIPLVTKGHAKGAQFGFSTAGMTLADLMGPIPADWGKRRAMLGSA